MGQETHQAVTLAKVVTDATPNKHQVYEYIALFDPDGDPLDVGPGTPQTGATVPLTGYAPHAVGAVAAADSANVAIAKLEARIIALETA